MGKLQELMQRHCPDGVEYKTLDELFDRQGGYTPSKSKLEFWDNGTVPWFRMEDIRANGTVLDDAIQHVTQAAVKRNGLFKAGSIMVATSATIGVHAMVTCDFLCNQRFTCITLKDEYVDAFDERFLNYYCDQLDRWCENHLNKGTFLSVNMTAFGEFKFPVLPIEVQREIVRLLDAYTAAHDALVAKLNEEMEHYSKLNDIAQKKLYEERLSGKWDTDALANHADIISGYPFSSEGYSETGIRVCGGVSIMPGHIDWTTCRYWPDDEGLEKYRLEAGDIVMALDRPWISTGFKLAEITEDDEGTLLVQRTARVRGTDLEQGYIRMMMERDDFREHCNASGNTVPHVAQKKLETYVVPIPPAEEQRSYVSVAGHLRQYCNELVRQFEAEKNLCEARLAEFRNQLLSFPEKVA